MWSHKLRIHHQDRRLLSIILCVPFSKHVMCPILRFACIYHNTNVFCTTNIQNQVNHRHSHNLFNKQKSLNTCDTFAQMQLVCINFTVDETAPHINNTRQSYSHCARAFQVIYFPTLDVSVS